MNISKKVFNQMVKDVNSVTDLKRERDNVRKAYEEVNERGELIQKQLRLTIDDTLRQLKNAQASNQHLSQEHARISTVAQQLAKEQERDHETIAILTRLLGKAVGANQWLIDHATPGTVVPSSK
jgi:hypothetical protein